MGFRTKNEINVQAQYYSPSNGEGSTLAQRTLQSIDIQIEY